MKDDRKYTVLFGHRTDAPDYHIALIADGFHELGSERMDSFTEDEMERAFDHVAGSYMFSSAMDTLIISRAYDEDGGVLQSKGKAWTREAAIELLIEELNECDDNPTAEWLARALKEGM